MKVYLCEQFGGFGELTARALVRDDDLTLLPSSGWLVVEKVENHKLMLDLQALIRDRGFVSLVENGQDH